MDFKKLLIGFNLIMILVLYSFSADINYALILLIIINASYFGLYYVIRKKQEDELTYLVNSIEKILNNSFSHEELKYDEHIVQKLNHSVLQLVDLHKKNSNQLLKSQRELQNTTTNIAHQLRNSVHAISLYSNSLSGKADASLLYDEIYKLSNFVEELIKLANVEVVDSNIEVSECVLNNVVLEAIKYNYVLAKQKEIVINYSDVNELLVHANYNWSVEAVINVINNAIKYSDNGANIDIRIESNYLYAKVIVVDNNGGIAEENLNKIFDKFYRGNNAKGIDGMGVGLYLTKNILIKQKGFIKVSVTESSNVFELYFLKTTKGTL